MIKSHMVGLRLDDEEHARLLKLARHFGIGPQEALRMILKSEVDALMNMGRQGAR